MSRPRPWEWSWRTWASGGSFWVFTTRRKDFCMDVMRSAKMALESLLLSLYPLIIERQGSQAEGSYWWSGKHAYWSMKWLYLQRARSQSVVIMPFHPFNLHIVLHIQLFIMHRHTHYLPCVCYLLFIICILCVFCDSIHALIVYVIFRAITYSVRTNYCQS